MAMITGMIQIVAEYIALALTGSMSCSWRSCSLVSQQWLGKGIRIASKTRMAARCPHMARSCGANLCRQCPFNGVKQSCGRSNRRAEFDPERTLAGQVDWPNYRHAVDPCDLR